MMAGAIAVLSSCGSDRAPTAQPPEIVTTPLPALTAVSPTTAAVVTTVPATVPATAVVATVPATESPTIEPPTTAPATTARVVPTTTATAATASTTVPTTGPTRTGWAIHDSIASQQSGAITKYDAVSCASESGPWHVVASFTVDGNLTQNVFYDVVIAPNGAGTLTGEEHSTWSSGETVDGTNAGTAQLTGSDPAAMLVLDYDSVVVIVDPRTGTDTQTDHHNKPLKVVPATRTECA